MKRRSSCDFYLVGQTRENIPDHKLCRNIDVLKYLFYKRDKEYETSKKHPALTKLICCPLKTGEIKTSCDISKTCSESPCVVAGIKRGYIKAGFPTISINKSVRMCLVYIKIGQI